MKNKYPFMHCTWTWFILDKTWKTSCSMSFWHPGFTVKEYLDTKIFKYCPYCGKEIVVNENESAE